MTSVVTSPCTKSSISINGICRNFSHRTRITVPVDWQHPMGKRNFQMVLKTLLAGIAVAGGIGSTYFLATGPLVYERFWPAERYTVLVWMVCAIIVSTIVIVLLRSTRLSWPVCIFGGGITMVVISASIAIANIILKSFIRAMIYGSGHGHLSFWINWLDL